MGPDTASVPMKSEVAKLDCRNYVSHFLHKCSRTDNWQVVNHIFKGVLPKLIIIHDRKKCSDPFLGRECRQLHEIKECFPVVPFHQRKQFCGWAEPCDVRIEDVRIAVDSSKRHALDLHAIDFVVRKLATLIV